MKAAYRTIEKVDATRRWQDASRAWCVRAIFATLLLIGFMPARVGATPSTDDVLKSIQDSMGKPTKVDSRPVILLAAGAGLVFLVLVLTSRRQQKAASPKVLNHPGRLMKEILREVPLKPAEMKQLKMLADSVEAETGETANPITLLLCPSLLAKGLKTIPTKIDRKAVAQVVRKLRLGQTDQNQ